MGRTVAVDQGDLMAASCELSRGRETPRTSSDDHDSHARHATGRMGT